MIAVVVVALFAMSSIVLAMHHTPEDRGKAMFNDPKRSGGTSGKSCSTYHPDGKGLEVSYRKEVRSQSQGVKNYPGKHDAVGKVIF